MLPAGVAEKLAGLGITTLDELRDHWSYGNRQLITAYLGDSPLRHGNCGRHFCQYSPSRAQTPRRMFQQYLEVQSASRSQQRRPRPAAGWCKGRGHEIPLDDGQAICLVGYLLDTAAPGGGRLIFRNSWGKAWAAKSDAAAGYGTLPFEYVKKYALEAFRVPCSKNASALVMPNCFCNASRSEAGNDLISWSSFISSSIVSAHRLANESKHGGNPTVVASRIVADSMPESQSRHRRNAKDPQLASL